MANGAASYTINDPTPPALAAATGTGTKLASMIRDAMGRVTTYTEYQTDGTTTAYSRAATYNNKSEASSDIVTVLRGSDTWVYSTTYYYDHLGNGTGTYQGGVVTRQVVTITKNGVAQTGNNTTNTYVWWDGALQNVSTYVSGATTNTSTFYYNDSGYLQSVYIQDGRPRTVSFISDGNNLILQRDENDNQSTGDPRELYYYFNGARVGDIGNNGTSDTDYVGSVSAHTVTSGTGPFRYGSAYSTQYADFDQSYDPINGLNYQSTSSRYTVQEGDTLEAIALRLWGDASFWYMIADANGLSGSETLVAGQTLRIPNKVHNAHNTNDVYKVYDPNEAIGDTSPTAGTPAAKPKGAKCGMFGAILLIVIAVVVTVLTYGALSGPMSTAISGAAATTAAGGVTTAGAMAAGAVAGVAGSVASQLVGVASGIQDKFSWKGVAMAAIGGAVTAGVANGISGLSGAGTGAAIGRGVLSNVITQGIGVATGLQHKFDFMGVAAAGIVAGVGHMAGDAMGVDWKAGNWKNDLMIGAGNMAGGIVAAAARSLVEGTNFGDNLMSVLPDVVGSTLGSIIARGIYDPAEPAGSAVDPKQGETTNTGADAGTTTETQHTPGAGQNDGKVGDAQSGTDGTLAPLKNFINVNLDDLDFGPLPEFSIDAQTTSAGSSESTQPRQWQDSSTGQWMYQDADGAVYAWNESQKNWIGSVTTTAISAINESKVATDIQVYMHYRFVMEDPMGRGAMFHGYLEIRSGSRQYYLAAGPEVEHDEAKTLHKLYSFMSGVEYLSGINSTFLNPALGDLTAYASDDMTQMKFSAYNKDGKLHANPPEPIYLGTVSSMDWGDATAILRGVAATVNTRSDYFPGGYYRGSTYNNNAVSFSGARALGITIPFVGDNGLGISERMFSGADEFIPPAPFQ